MTAGISSGDLLRGIRDFLPFTSDGSKSAKITAAAPAKFKLIY